MKPILLACLLLAGCSTYQSSCPPPKVYPPEVSGQLADELEGKHPGTTLAPDSVIPGVVGDFMTERDLLRACQ